MGKLLGFFKLLLEHKEKVVLGALLSAFIWVGVAQWDEIKGGASGNNNDGKKGPKPKVPPREPQEFGVPKLGNEVPLDDLHELVNVSIFAPPKDSSSHFSWPYQPDSSLNICQSMAQAGITSKTHMGVAMNQTGLPRRQR